MRAQNNWTAAKSRQDGVYREVNARVLKQADVIGITTSGMANNMDLLKSIHSKAIMCEDAGEVLEAHLLAALLPSIEHAILIGDHLQLRPQIASPRRCYTYAPRIEMTAGLLVRKSFPLRVSSSIHACFVSPRLVLMVSSCILASNSNLTTNDPVI